GPLDPSQQGYHITSASCLSSKKGIYSTCVRNLVLHKCLVWIAEGKRPHIFEVAGGKPLHQMHITSENQKWTHKPSESSRCSHHLCSLIAAYIHLDTFAQSLFCNLRKPLPRCCIHIFLAADRT